MVCFGHISVKMQNAKKVYKIRLIILYGVTDETDSAEQYGFNIKKGLNI